MTAPRLPTDDRTALMGYGVVRHARLKPTPNQFRYPTWFVLLPMRQLAHCAQQGLAINRPGAVSFFDTDHGDGRPPSAGGAIAWLDELLVQQGIADATGPVWLHTYPRVLGYAFKPVSFWYCHRPDGALRAIVAEVNNTFGERHCYLLDQPALGVELTTDKVFHVSPFCNVEGRYRFRFMTTAQHDRPRTVVRIDYDDATGPLLQTSVSGHLHPLTPQRLRSALWRYPAMTIMVVARIHWQAFKLWTKRVRFYRKPPPPLQAVTR